MEQRPGDAKAREEQFRRTALYYFLPLVILNFLAGAKVMANNPGIFPNEHFIALFVAAALSAAGVLILLDKRHLMAVSIFLCLSLTVFFLYRQFSLLYGPAVLDESTTVFKPLFGYVAILYFACYVFLPVEWAERYCWAVYASLATMVCVRLLPEWAYFSERQGAPDLLLFMLVANPMFILTGRLLRRLQAALSESELELELSRREVDLLARVADSEQQLQRAIEGSRDALWELRDAGTGEMWFSPQAGELLGIDPSELPTDLKGVIALYHPDDLERVRIKFENSLQTRERYEAEIRLRHASGEYRWYSLKGVPSVNRATGKLCISGSLQSIHERKLAEEALQASNEALSQFAAVAAHDLKSPLRKIRMNLDRLEHAFENAPDKVPRFFSTMHRVTENMTELVDRLLDYAAANQRTESGEISLHLVLQDVLEVLEQEIAAKGATIEVAGELPMAWCNAGDLRQVFQNLISNALKFCERTPEVVIHATAYDDRIAVSVRDNGIGIDSQHLAKIRQPLERLHSASEYAGQGLGLATVERILERNGGSLTIHSKPGEGSEFIVHLPRFAPSGSDSA